MFHRKLLALLLLFVPSTLLAVPQLQREARTYTVRGTVVNSATGEPVNGALVQMQVARMRSMLTAADGKFQFEGVPNGTFAFTVRKPGYFSREEVGGNGVQPNNIRTAEERPVTLKLIPEGVVFGRVTGENGESAGFLPVQLLGDRVENGKRTRQNLRSVRTDDQGEFRLAELMPGKYFVFIGPSPWPMSFPPRLSQTGARGYPGLFYPGVPDISSATPIEIAPGTHAEINLSMTSQPFYRITGTVSGYLPEQGVGFEMSSASGQPIGAGIELDQARGTFRSSWVPAGVCTIFAQSQDPKTNQINYAVQRLNVASDLSGVHLALLPSATIPLNIRVEATRSDAQGSVGSYFHSSLGGTPVPARVLLTSQEHISTNTQQYSESVTPEDPTPAIRNVAPGVYSVEVNANGPYYVQSVRSGTSDLLQQSLTVAPGASAQPIEVVLRDDFATLQGNLLFGGESQFATLIIMPADFLTNATSQRRNVVMNSGPSFQISQLAPGEYKILAVESSDALEYGDPEAMSKYLSKALEISLVPNQKAKVDLAVVHIGETP